MAFSAAAFRAGFDGRDTTFAAVVAAGGTASTAAGSAAGGGTVSTASTARAASGATGDGRGPRWTTPYARATTASDITTIAPLNCTSSSTVRADVLSSTCGRRLDV